MPRRNFPSIHSRKYLEDLGYRIANVERRNKYSKNSFDLFGIYDLLGIGKIGTPVEGKTIAVQTTSRQHISDRYRKVVVTSAFLESLAAGWKVEIHGWRKEKNGRYSLKVVDAFEEVKNASKDLWEDVSNAQGGGEGGEEEGDPKTGRLRSNGRTSSEEEQREVTNGAEATEVPFAEGEQKGQEENRS